jgi:hypothetical protein
MSIDEYTITARMILSNLRGGGYAPEAGAARR